MGIEVTRDVRDLKYTQNVEKFMKNIRKTDYVIMIISDDFLKSKNCMYELLEFIKDDNYKDRILPIIIKGSPIFDSQSHYYYIKYWEDQIKELKQTLNSLNPENTISIVEELKIITNISHSIGEFLRMLSNMKCLTYDEIIINNYYDLYQKIGFDYVFLIQELYLISQIKDLDKREMELEKLIIKYPKHKIANYQKAVLAHTRGNYFKARAYLENFINDIDDSDEHVLNYLGVLLMTQFGEIKQSEEYFNRVLQLNPNSDTAYTNLGILYHDYLKNYVKSKEYSLKAIELNPSNDSACNNLARIHADIEHNYSKAKEFYELAILINPRNINAHLNLADLLDKHFNDGRKAGELYKKILQLEPENERANYNLAVIYVEYFKDYEMAKKHYEVAVKINPSNEIGLSNLGFVYHELGLFDKEEICYLKAIELKPDYWSPRNNLANLYLYELQDFDRAKIQFEKCLTLEPNNPVIHFNYCAMNPTANKLGKDSPIDFETAKEHYLKAVSLNRSLRRTYLDDYFKLKMIY
jgi:tetratricopeptide (TPR) repeat protein